MKYGIHSIRTFFQIVKNFNNWPKAIYYLFVPPRGEKSIKLKSGRKVYFDQSTDIFLINSLFSGEYDINLREEASKILDVGAHKGFACLWLLSKYPSSKIVCCEPNPALLPLLKKNVEGLNVEVKNVAVSSKTDKIPMVLDDNSTRSFVGEEGSLLIDAQALSEIVNDYGFFDIMKIDVEGHEVDIINNTNPEVFSKIGCIVGEAHNTFDDIAESLKKNYKVFNKERNDKTSTFSAF